MEKTLKREIGYKPEKTTKKVAPTKVVDTPSPETTPVVAIIELVNKRNQKATPALAEDHKSKALKITTWLKAHPLIAWGRMCVALKIDKGNFKKALESEKPSINSENIAKIESALKDYGYVK